MSGRDYSHFWIFQSRETGVVAENWFYFYYSEHKVGEGPYRGKRCVLCSGLLD